MDLVIKCNLFDKTSDWKLELDQKTSTVKKPLSREKTSSDPNFHFFWNI